MTRSRRVGVKGRETDLDSNQFPMFSIAWNTQRDSQSWVKKRRREEIEATWAGKGIVKNGRGQSSQ